MNIRIPESTPVAHTGIEKHVVSAREQAIVSEDNKRLKLTSKKAGGFALEFTTHLGADEALETIANHLEAIDPNQSAVITTGFGIQHEQPTVNVARIVKEGAQPVLRVAAGIGTHDFTWEQQADGVHLATIEGPYYNRHLVEATVNQSVDAETAIQMEALIAAADEVMAKDIVA